MSGHSKWHSIRHKKAKEDAKRGKVFTTVVKEITLAAREGGGNPDNNPRLRQALLNAKSVNMPSQNIDRAIKKGTGELPGVSYEEATYEGYGPGGVAVYLQVLTDNKNRTTGEIRHLFGKFNGSLGEPGCVNWLFIKKGVITVDKGAIAEEDLLDRALEAGAEDMNAEESSYEITTEVTSLYEVKSALEAKGVTVGDAEITMLPSNTVAIEGGDAKNMLRLMDELEDHDDVTKVYANFDISEAVMEELSE